MSFNCSLFKGLPKINFEKEYIRNYFYLAGVEEKYWVIYHFSVVTLAQGRKLVLFLAISEL